MKFERASRLIDRLVSVVSPERALSRMRARTSLRIMGASGGALSSEHSGNIPPAGSEAHPDNDIVPDSGKQRRRCTLAYYNNSLARGIVDSQVRQCVGSIAVQADTGDTASDRLIEGEWYRLLDAGLTDTIRQLATHLLVDGGAVANPLGRLSDPVDIEVLPYRRIKTPYDLKTQNLVRDGFEYDASGRKTIAVHVELEESSYDSVYSNGDQARVPLFAHPCLPRLAGQTKGLPWYTAAIQRLEMVDRWMNALLTSAELHAYVVALVRSAGKDARGMASSATTLGPDQEKKIYKFAREHRFMFLPDGGDYSLVQANAPQVAEFLVWNLRFVARALGVSFERLTYDLSKTSFSSTKFGDRDDRITVLEHQAIVIRNILTPITGRICSAFALRGMLPAPALYAADPQAFVSSVRFQLPGRPPVDELKAEKANEAALRNRTASRTRIAATQGTDADEIEAEIIREDRRFFERRQQMYLECGFPVDAAREYALGDLRGEQAAQLVAPVETQQVSTVDNSDGGEE